MSDPWETSALDFMDLPPMPDVRDTYSYYQDYLKRDFEREYLGYLPDDKKWETAICIWAQYYYSLEEYKQKVNSPYYGYDYSILYPNYYPGRQFDEFQHNLEYHVTNALRAYGIDNYISEDARKRVVYCSFNELKEIIRRHEFPRQTPVGEIIEICEYKLAEKLFEAIENHIQSTGNKPILGVHIDNLNIGYFCKASKKAWVINIMIICKEPELFKNNVYGQEILKELGIMV